MARLSCCWILCFLVLLPTQAHAWEWWWLNPWYWCKGHFYSVDDDDDVEQGLIPQQETCEASEEEEVDIESFQQYPELFAMSLPPELQAIVAQELPPDLLEYACRDKQLCLVINRLFKELSRVATAQELKHHQLFRLVVSITSLLGGAINRIAAYPGLVALLGMTRLPSTAVKAISGLVTGCSLLSSNMLAVSGANSIRCEGYRNARDCMTAVVALAAVVVDCGMAYRGVTDLSDSPALGAVSIYFMAIGLFPLLYNKVESLPYVLRGQNPELEMLPERSFRLIGKMLRRMQAEGIGFEPEHEPDRVRIGRDMLGLNGSHSVFRWLLGQLCLYYPEGEARNTLSMMWDSGVFDGDPDPLRMIPEILHEQAQQRRKSTGEALANALLLTVCAGPALVYVFADSSSLVALLEKELDSLQFCQGAGETVTYVLLQGGALAFMSGKGLASAQNGAKNIRRLISWLRGCCTGQGEPVPISVYVLNVFGGCMALSYAGNNIGSMAGNILRSPCLSHGNGALYVLPAIAGLGGFGFNAGSGPELRKIPITFKEFIEWLRSCPSGSCAQGSQPLINEESPFAENEGDGSYGSDGSTTPVEENDEQWLTDQGLPANLLHVVGAQDEGNINGQQKAFLQKLSALIQRKRARVHNVARNGNCLYQSLLEVFPTSAANIDDLKKRLYKKLLKLLRKRDLADEEKRFLKNMSPQELAQLMRDLLHGIQPNLAMLQLAALELQVDITFIENVEGHLIVQHITLHNPGVLNNMQEMAIPAGPVIVHNGIGHWLWMELQQEEPFEASFTAENQAVVINLADNENQNNNNPGSGSSQNSTCQSSQCTGAGNSTVQNVLQLELDVGTVGLMGSWLQQ